MSINGLGIIPQQIVIAGGGGPPPPPPPPSPAEISFVGSKTITFNSGSPTYNFQSLVGGTAQAGDFYIIWAAEVDTTAGVPGHTTPPGHVGRLHARAQAESRDYASFCDYGFIEDVSTDQGQLITSFSRTRLAAILVFRYVDPDTPLDVTTVETFGANGILPNPGAITPVTNDAVVLALGGSSAPIGARNYDALPGYTTLLVANYENATQGRAFFGAFSVPWGTADGAVDPPAFTISGGDRTDGARQALTIALRPAS